MKESERLVIHRKQHSKLCFGSQKKKAVNRGKTEDTIPFIDNLIKDVDPESVSEIKTAIMDKAAQGAAPTFSLACVAGT